MAETLLVVCEARDDFELVSGWIDRVLREKGPVWLADNLEHCRVWHEGDYGAPFVRWSQLKSMVHGRVLGYGQEKGHWASEARKAVLLAEETNRRTIRLRGLVLARDLDGDSTKREEYLTAGRQPTPFVIVIATPQPEREAWLLNAFEPRDGNERKRLAALKRELALDPVSGAHFLLGKPGESRDIKRVVRQLFGDAKSFRITECIEKTPLETLRERGAETFLRDFLDEVREKLLPEFAPGRY